MANLPPKRKPGGLKGKIWIAEDFNAPMTEDELAEWESLSGTLSEWSLEHDETEFAKPSQTEISKPLP